MAEKNFEVGVGIIPVPDGIDLPDHLRISLVMGINKDAAHKVDLADWPARIAALVGLSKENNLRVMFYNAKREPLHPKPYRNAILHPSARIGKVQERARSVWREMMPFPDVEVLHARLAPKAKLTLAARIAAAEQTGHYSARRIVDTFTVMRAEYMATMLRTRLIANEHGALWSVQGGPSATGVVPVGHKQAHASTIAPFRFQMDRKLLNALSRPLEGKALGDQSIPFFGKAIPLSQLHASEHARRIRANMQKLGLPLPPEKESETETNEEKEQKANLLAFNTHSPLMIRHMVQSLLLETPLNTKALETVAVIASRSEKVKIEAYLSSRAGLAAIDFLTTFGPARPPRSMTYACLTPTEKAAEEEKNRSDDIHAKFTGIHARPILAKLLNFTVDITMPVPENMPPMGYVQVYMDGEDPARAPLVAFRHGARSGSQFRPGSIRELSPKEKSPVVEGLGLPLKDGMVDLGDKRFSLSCVDVHSLVNTSRVQLQELHQAERNAGDDRDTSPRLMEERSRGIQLLDDETLATMARQVHQPAPVSALIHAEELVTGYRVFARRTTARGEVRSWRSLMARTVRYGPIAASYAEGAGRAQLSWKPYSDFREREHGAIRPLPRAAPAKGTLVAPSHIFTWFGETMGVPARGDGKPLSCEDSARERRRVGIGIIYDYSNDPDDRVPALRIDSLYEFALAPVYLHGGGPTLVEVAAMKPVTAGIPFSRPNDVQAPLMLLGPDDPMFNKGKRRKNEHIDRVVLRSGAGMATNAAQRYLVPPRVDFTAAEQFGLLDASTFDHPLGAFRRFDRSEDGDFAQLRVPGSEQDLAYVLQGERGARARHGYFPDPLARNLSIAFERDERTPAGFPDRTPPLAFWSASASARAGYAACLQAVPIELAFERWSGAARGARVVRDGYSGQLNDPSMRIPRLTIQLAPAEDITVWIWCWPDVDALSHARPELAWQLATTFFISRTSLARQMVDEVAATGASKDDLPMPPQLAAMVEAKTIDPADAEAAAWLTRQMTTAPRAGTATPKRAGDLTALLEKVYAALEKAMFHALPFNGVNGWRKLHLVHAVDKPRRVPSLPERDGMFALRLRPSETMAKHLADVGEKALRLSDQDGGSKIFFGGSIHFDRASTRSVRVEGSWPQLDYALAIRKETRPDGGVYYVDRPPQSDQVLFDLRDIPRDSGRAEHDSLDLLRDENGKLRELSSQSQSSGASATAARRINLRIVATSRFNEDFPPETERGADKLGKFEVETRPYRGPGMTGKSTTREIEICLPATVRPPPPIVTKYEFIAPEQRVRIDREHLVVRKHYFPRLYLDESWRVSGSDELLAIVFAPAGVIEDRKYDRTSPQPELGPSLKADYADEFSRFLALPVDKRMLPADYCAPPNPNALCASFTSDDLDHVTRWGADPTAAPMARMEALILPDRFSGHVGSVSSVPMPLPATQPGSRDETERRNVGVLLYRPQLEASSGRWYVDIGIDPGGAHAPFVRLALARYQPDALNNAKLDLRMSAPLLFDPLRIPASRTVEVRHAAGKPIMARVSGAGYRRREPDGVVQAIRHLTDMPVQSIELMRRTDSAPHAWLQVHGPDGLPLKNAQVQAKPLGAMLQWSHDFILPPSAQQQRYALVIDEIDLHIPDSELDKLPAPSPVKGPPPVPVLVARPGFFSMMIELDTAEELA